MTGAGGDRATEPGRRNQSSSLRRALAVLNYVRDHGADGGDASLARIAEDLGLSKSTVLRLTAPLIEGDLLTRDPAGGFRLGPGALRLGQAYLSSLDLRTAAAEPLRRLQHAVGETCHLVVYDAPDVVYIDKVENEHNVRMASRVGSRIPAYRTAVGKAMLAWLGDEAVQEVVAAGMVRRTEHTITDPARLAAELDGTRRAGYAVDDRENEPEVRCVAAPIFDHTDSVAGALSVSGLVSRMTPARVREIGPMVARVGLDISRVLGATRTRQEQPAARRQQDRRPYQQPDRHPDRQPDQQPDLGARNP